MDASAYTLTNGSSPALLGGGRARGDSGAGNIGAGGRGPPLMMEDGKFKFQRDDQLPKPRDFTGAPKRYRAGRGSSVPLDISAFE